MNDSNNYSLWICGLLCGLPIGLTLLTIIIFRAFAKRRITMNVEQTSIPLPDVQPGTKRIAVYFDLEERKPAPEPEEPEE